MTHPLVTFMSQFDEMGEIYKHGALLRLAQSGEVHLGFETHLHDLHRIHALQEAGFLTFEHKTNYYGPKHLPEQCEDAYHLKPTIMTMDAIRAYESTDLSVRKNRAAASYVGDEGYGVF